MNEDVQKLLDGLGPEAQALFMQVRALVTEAAGGGAQEALWARLPTYTANGRFVRLIPFKDHLNVEAAAALSHRERLPEYRFTPKGMLQLRVGQPVPARELRQIFEETLGA